MTIIEERLQAHYDFVCEHYNEDQILGVFLYGSQNYNTHTFHSDVDTKAIYIPTLAELSFDKPVSKELVLPNGEHCEVKDIREMVKNFKKQNINFVEVLFTEYYILNVKFEELWNKYFINNREKIAVYDVNVAVRSMSHQALHTIRQNPKDPKKISNALRLLYFLQGYMRGDSYIKCLQGDTLRANYLKAVKNNLYGEEALKPMVDYAIIALDEYTKADLPPRLEKDEKARLDLRMNKGCLEMIKLIF